LPRLAGSSARFNLSGLGRAGGKNKNMEAYKYNKINPAESGDYRRAAFVERFVSEDTNSHLKKWCEKFRSEPGFIGFAYNSGGGGTPSRYAITEGGIYKY